MSEQSLAARAWNATKSESDLEFDAIPNLDFKENLNYRAAKVKETGVAITNFEKECAKITAAEPDDPSPMAVVDDSPNAVASDAAPAAAKSPSADPAEFHSDGTQKKTFTDAEAAAADGPTVESLVKDNDRKALDKLAKKAGLDGNDFTSKKEVAEAIIAAGKGSSDAASDPSGDLAAAVKEESTAPLHP